MKFPKKSENVTFFNSRDYASSKELENSDARFSKNAKTSNVGHFRPKRPILDKTVKIMKKRTWNVFLALKSPNCKVSEKINERFPRKRVA